MSKATHVLLTVILSFLQLVNCLNLQETRLGLKLPLLANKIGFCSHYFQYVRTEEFITGRLTLPNIRNGDTIKMQFYQYDFGYKFNFNGSILPDESSEEIIDRLKNGQPISFRVDFPIKVDAPNLENIYINDKELCATFFSGTGEKLIITHTMEIVNNTIAVYAHNINIPHFTRVSTCGLDDTESPDTEVTPFIFGGTVLRRGEYPWLTAIYKKQTDGITFICGGSLVNSQMILTAAHCAQGLTAAQIFVVLGRYNLSNTEEDNIVTREIEIVLPHPEFKQNSNFSDADLALLQMKTPVSFTKFIKPICLWSEPADESLVVGRSGVVAGWGSDDVGNIVSKVPKKVKTSVVSEIECLRSLPKFTQLTSPRTLCAGKRDGSGPCEGDSGGALMIYRNGHWTLRGVVSSGIIFQQRCNSQEYTIYCDVAKHLPWLETYVGQQEEPLTGSIEDVCGKQGTESRSEHPWSAAVYRKLFVGAMFYGSGVLISSRTVLAPANCFYGLTAGDLKIYAGRYDLNNINENRVEARDVSTLIRHPRFSEASNQLFYDYDIALLHMETAVVFTEFIKPICLWSGLSDQSQIVGKPTTLLSWNMLTIFDGSSAVPQSKEVDVATIQKCQHAGYNVGTSTSFLCTPHFGNNIDGFLMLKRDGRLLLRGVGTGNLANIERYNATNFRLFTDITEYLTWIQSNTLS